MESADDSASVVGRLAWQNGEVASENPLPKLLTMKFWKKKRLGLIVLKPKAAGQKVEKTLQISREDFPTPEN